MVSNVRWPFHVHLMQLGSGGHSGMFTFHRSRGGSEISLWKGFELRLRCASFTPSCCYPSDCRTSCVYWEILKLAAELLVTQSNLWRFKLKLGPVQARAESTLSRSKDFDIWPWAGPSFTAFLYFCWCWPWAGPYNIWFLVLCRPELIWWQLDRVRALHMLVRPMNISLSFLESLAATRSTENASCCMKRRWNWPTGVARLPSMSLVHSKDELGMPVKISACKNLRATVVWSWFWSDWIECSNLMTLLNYRQILRRFSLVFRDASHRTSKNILLSLNELCESCNNTKFNYLTKLSDGGIWGELDLAKNRDKWSWPLWMVKSFLWRLSAKVWTSSSVKTQFLMHILPMLDDGIAVAKTPSTMRTMLNTMMIGMNGNLMKMTSNGQMRVLHTMRMMNVKRPMQPMRMQRPSTMRCWQTMLRPSRNWHSFVSHAAFSQLWLWHQMAEDMVEKDLQRASMSRARVKPSPNNCLDLLHAPKNVVEQPLEVQKLVQASAFVVDKQAIGHEIVRRLELESAKQRLRQVTLWW